VLAPAPAAHGSGLAALGATASRDSLAGTGPKPCEPVTPQPPARARCRDAGMPLAHRVSGRGIGKWDFRDAGLSAPAKLTAPEPFVEWERHKPGPGSLFDRQTGFSAGGL